MKMIVAVAAIVLLACSTASAGWGHGVLYAVPGPVVYGAYMPVTPYYAAYPAPVVVARPVVVAPRVVYRPAVVVPAPVYYAPGVIVHPKVYVRGQPVRNMIRAVTP